MSCLETVITAESHEVNLIRRYSLLKGTRHYLPVKLARRLAIGLFTAFILWQGALTYIERQELAQARLQLSQNEDQNISCEKAKYERSLFLSKLRQADPVLDSILKAK